MFPDCFYAGSVIFLSLLGWSRKKSLNVSSPLRHPDARPWAALIFLCLEDLQGYNMRQRILIYIMGHCRFVYRIYPLVNWSFNRMPRKILIFQKDSSSINGPFITIYHSYVWKKWWNVLLFWLGISRMCSWNIWVNHGKPQNRWIAGRKIFPWSGALFPAVPGPNR